MGVKSTTDDGEVSEKSAFEQDAEAALDELGERFQKHSRTFTHSNSTDLVLAPEHPAINDDGDETKIFFYRSERHAVERHNFKFEFIAESPHTSSSEFWFEHQQ